MLYKSTRGGTEELKASLAILKGLADDGGLYMPSSIPGFDCDIYSFKDRSYNELAYEVMKLFLDDYSKSELKACINSAYDEKFDTADIAEVVKVSDVYMLELFHGSTIAFKDMALSILPYLLTTAMKKHSIDKKVLILTATSGDTGKAAMAGFADVENTEIIVFYPKGGVSKIQEIQMLTQKGANTHVVSVEGNFDDAQSGVKEIFNDEAFAKELEEKGIVLSSANSINIGRLVPQIVYYVYAYLKLLRAGEISKGEKINVCVPTGNFGNILAAYIAKSMGLPIAKLICASNDNKVLYDFFKSGRYDKNRDFILTKSPSMDILISSNLERLLYLALSRDGIKTKELMEKLSKDGSYELGKEDREFMSDFVGVYADEKEMSEAIAKLYKEADYIMDTHTAVAYAGYKKYKDETKDATKTVIAATASPYKFSASVVKAIDKDFNSEDEWDSIDRLEALGSIEIPNAVEELKDAHIMHNLSCKIEDMKSLIRDILC